MTLHRRTNGPAQTKRLPAFAAGLKHGVPIFVAILGAGLIGCADAIRVVSDGPKDRATKVEELTDAIATRFNNPERSGRFEQTRRRLVSGALHPSRVFSDTTLWTSTTTNFRSLTAHGSLTERGYRFDVVDRAPLTDVGDTRHVINLRRLGDGEYQWATGVDFAVGSITAADLAAMIQALLTMGAGQEGSTLLAGARQSFPRSSAVLAKLFSVDSLTLRPGPHGTTAVSMVASTHTERLRATAPHFADYLAKYFEGSKFRILVTDRSGAPYFEAIGGAKKLSVHYRVLGSQLVSGTGSPRPLPDSLKMISDLSMRVRMFDAGWKNLAMDFVISRTSRSRSWLFTARTEPDWTLPLATARLIRSPLRRPFQGAGSTVELAIIDSAGGQSILARRARLDVKESAIMRFLSSLVSRVFDDLDAAVEREEAEYVRELMAAFQQDARTHFIR